MEQVDKYQLITLGELFQQGKCSFQIPDFQRGYSWELEQRKDLMEDIQYVIESGFSYKHFTGTIVTSLNKKLTEENNWPTYDIVDGQQRLTTILIMLSVLIRMMKKSDRTSNLEELSRLERMFIVEPIDIGRSIRKFHSGRDQDDLFRSILIEGTTKGKDLKTKSDRNLFDAISEVTDWMESVDLEDLKRCILENLGFLLYSPENSSELGIMFEVINNRGKGLSQLEKIKNYLFYYSEKNGLTDLKKSAISSWPNILTRLNTIGYTSNDDENSFLRTCWIVAKDTNKSKSYQVYDQLKSLWPPNNKEDWSSLKEFVKFVESAAQSYCKVFTDQADSPEEKRWLGRLSHHPQTASVLPIILAVFERVENSLERAAIFELVEKLNFRYYVSGIANRSDSGQGELFRMGFRIFNYYGNIHEEELIDFKWIKKSLVNFIQNNANDIAFIKELTLDEDESGDYYNWNGLKFFLASYEEHLRREQKSSTNISNLLAGRDKETPNDFLHKEHIWAKKDFTHFSDEDNPDINKRRLGNFILLKETLNIKVSNKPPEDKVRLYFEDKKVEPNTWMIRELKDQFDKIAEDESKHWDRRRQNYWKKTYQRFLDWRETKLINFALCRWGVEELPNRIKSITVDYSKTDKERYLLNQTL